MSNVTIGSREDSSSLHRSYAVLAAGTLVAIAIVVTALTAPGRGIVANPQGGVWIERDGTLFLCRASTSGPAPCVDLATGQPLTYAELPR
ncbi:hypothetical protein Plav_1512 [Parvibaculum lavamentivorans DS-1]|uniref:Uncharacterized protein n=1 Tax=Parvibaculum lavamentivorans (strain DS-1 / DSM 13023 / NCIMB 13966) TaxID=402881 RepID=A7HT98_PARL1|nr:hypothetical protein [Parvibaculum lavamentivorans]ABS63131.1 hypothetical protein Plav_1512 [Parvibaculum lavamentivorans DS-1]